MIAWMAFAAAMAALAGIAALAAERALRLLRLPTRGAWVAALAASLVLPFALPRPARMESGAQAVGALRQAAGYAVAGDADPWLAQTPAGPSIRGRVEAALPWAWGACTLAVAAALAVAALRLARRRRAWPLETIAGETVLVSPSVGPAVVGFVRPRIVMPRWTLDWAEPLQRLMLRHEREHVLAGDPLLLLAGLVAVALAPWSPALWWQLRRLRLAMEVDCDARTLRATGDVLEYGRLLLEIGRLGGAGAPVPLMSFSEPRSFLERRITVMTMPIPVHRRRLVLAWAAVASVTAVSLAALPAPARVPLLPARTAAPAAPLLPSVTRRASAPAFTSAPATLAPVVATAAAPGTTLAATALAQPVRALQRDTTPVWQIQQVDRMPEFTNVEAMRRVFERAYPPLLRDAGIGGTVTVEFVVGTDGAAQNPTVLYSTHEAFGPAAIEVVKVARFTPAVKNGQPVRVRVALPVTFPAPRDASSSVPARSATPAALPATAQRDTSPVWQLSEVDSQPRLVNVDAVARLIDRTYPPQLRGAGIRGEVEVELVVGADGVPQNVSVLRANHEAFAQAATAVVNTARFRPAVKDGRPVRVRIRLPITMRSTPANPPAQPAGNGDDAGTTE